MTRIDDTEKNVGCIAFSFCLFVVFLIAGVAMLSVGAVYVSYNNSPISPEGCYALISIGIVSIIFSGIFCLVALIGAISCLCDMITW